MPGPTDIVYSQVEADAVIRGDKAFDSVGFLQPIGSNPALPQRVQCTSLVKLNSPVYNPDDFGKDVSFSVAIRKNDGFSFILGLDRTTLHRVDYQWRSGRKKQCVCRPFEMDYEPHIHTYHEECWRNRRKLYLDDLDEHTTFTDALQAYLEATSLSWDDRLRTRFGSYADRAYWGPGAQTTLFPLTTVLDGETA